MKRAIIILLTLACSRETPIATETQVRHDEESTAIKEPGDAQPVATTGESGSSPPHQDGRNVARPSALSFANLESIPLSSTPISDSLGATPCPDAATLARWVDDARKTKYRSGYDWLLSTRARDPGCLAITAWRGSGLTFQEWLGRNGFRSPAAKCTHVRWIAVEHETDIARFEVWHPIVPEDVAVVYAPANFHGPGMFVIEFELGCWQGDEFSVLNVVRDERVMRVADKPVTPKPVDPPKPEPDPPVTPTICKHVETFSVAELERFGVREDCTGRDCAKGGPRVVAIRDVISREVYPLIGGKSIEIPYQCGKPQIGRRFTFEPKHGMKTINIAGQAR